jgi:bifunctional non-homologous end joining protein LigD
VSDVTDRSGPLETYRAKRDFSLTPEPAGEALEEDSHSRLFVVQRHRARRTHYDFRLEVDGVLASWAMPKGPTLDPSVRSLAVHVEDHPIEYRDFEGIIPAGQYGGGDVIVWDRGTWVPAESVDPAKSIAKGELHFDLYGQKLHGRFALVRTRFQGRQEQWLMIHKHDADAVDGWSPDAYPQSVKSGRTNEEVKAAPSSVWRSDRDPAEAELELTGDGPFDPPESKANAPSSSTRRAAAGAKPGEGTRARKPTDPGRDAPTEQTWDAPSADELADLDALGEQGTWALQGRELRLTNLNKPLFPGRDGEPAVTKRDLIRYYAGIGPVMLPFLADRPVNLHRYPNGSDRPGFWHKQVPHYVPDWITRWRYDDAGPGDSEWYFVIDSVATLAWMANYAAVELHPWTSAIPDVHRPTWALIDIDPGSETSPEDLLTLARLYRAGLEHLDVAAAPKVSGQRGIHIYVPIEAVYTFEQTSSWVEKLSRAVGATVPKLVSWTWQKSERRGLARLDYTQNAINKTLVAPYSVRPAPGAPVSAPIRWDELDNDALRSDAWTVRSIMARLAESGDPFAGLRGRAQLLPDL